MNPKQFPTLDLKIELQENDEDQEENDIDVEDEIFDNDDWGESDSSEEIEETETE